jgi:hypothetical protein
MVVAEQGRVVHVRDGVADAVYIGRANGRARLKGSPFANPFTITAYGDRALVMMAYAEALRFGDLRHLLADLPALRGKPLACWCRHDGEDPDPGNACHADILLRLLDWFSDEDLRAMAS